jgi:hypothetical protein
MKRILRRIRKFFSRKVVITYTHYYENSNKEIVFGVLTKSGRGVVYLFNEYGCTVKLKNTEVTKIPRENV